MITHGASPALGRPIAGNRRSAWLRIPHVSLTVRLIILVLIAICPGNPDPGLQRIRTAQSARSRHSPQVVQITKQFGEEIGELREGARQLLLALAQLTPVKLHDSEACSALFGTLASQYANYSLLAAADTDGRIFCSSEPLAYSSVADEPFFKRAYGAGRARRRQLLGRPGERPAHDPLCAEIRRRRLDIPPGVVFAGLDLRWLSEHLKERGLSPTSSILIADREGNIIARLPNPEALVGKNMRKSHEEIMDGNTTGWEEAVGVDGVTRIFGYVPPALPPRDFFLSAGQSKVEAFAAIDSATARGIALIVFGLLAATFAAIVGGRRFLAGTNKRPAALCH